jgi:tetratricopeptide (TPR) repeat protein
LAVNGDLDKALADYDRAIKLDSAFAEARFNRALAYFAKKDSDKALADYREVIRLDPRTTEAYKNWGRAEDKEKRAKAVDRLEESLLKAKPEAETHSKQATALYKAGEFDKAIAEYDRALELYPRYTEVYYNRGLAYRQKENVAKAVADYTQAIRLDPKYIRAYYNRGHVYYTRGEYDRALADFNKILDLEPTNADALKGREAIVKMPKAGE